MENIIKRALIFVIAVGLGSGFAAAPAQARVSLSDLQAQIDALEDQIADLQAEVDALDGHSLDASDGDPEDALFVDEEGNVGIGTTYPDEKLHVEGDIFLGKADGSTRYIRMPRTVFGNNGNLELQAGGVPGISSSALQGGNIVLRAGDLNTAGSYWVGSGSIHLYAGKNHYTDNYHGDIHLYAGNNYEERLTVIGETGNVGIGTTSPQGRLDVNGAIYQRGGVLHADYVFDPGYYLESIEANAKFMWENKHLKAIPKAKKDDQGREIVDVGSHRRGIVEELEKAHIYIEQLHKRNTVLEERLSKLEALLNIK